MYLSIYLFIHLFIHVFIYGLIYWSIYLSNYLSTYLSIYLYFSFYPSIHLFIYYISNISLHHIYVYIYGEYASPGFITIPSLLGSPAALRSPNRRAPSPTKVLAQWASGRCAAQRHGSSFTLALVLAHPASLYIYIYMSQKIGRENSHYFHGIWCVYLFSYTHTHINIISKATPSPTTISTPWWRPLATESPWQWQVPQTLKTSRDLPFIGNSLALQPTIANPSPNLQVATSKTLRSVSTKALSSGNIFTWDGLPISDSSIQHHPGPFRPSLWSFRSRQPASGFPFANIAAWDRGLGDHPLGLTRFWKSAPDRNRWIMLDLS